MLDLNTLRLIFLNDSLWQVSVAKLRGNWVVLDDAASEAVLLMEGLLHPTARYGTKRLLWELAEGHLTPTPAVIQGIKEKEEEVQLARPLPHLPLLALEHGTFCPCAGSPAAAGFLAFFRQERGKTVLASSFRFLHKKI